MQTLIKTTLVSINQATSIQIKDKHSWRFCNNDWRNRQLCAN